MPEVRLSRARLGAAAAKRSIRQLVRVFAGVLILMTGNEVHAKRNAEPMPPGVRIEWTDEIGPVFADARGRTLYTWTAEAKPGKSSCDSTRYTQIVGIGSVRYSLPQANERRTCQEIWPPLLARPDSEPVGLWSIISRDDGSRQWAYQDRAVYSYLYDRGPGQINGLPPAGFALGARRPLQAPAGVPSGIIAKSSIYGLMMLTSQGQPLYSLAAETASKWRCTQACLNRWKPFRAPASGHSPEFAWSIVRRSSGLPQWAYRGKPLYTYAGDIESIDVNGLEEQDWSLAVLKLPLAPPSDITISMTADGEVFADRSGRTLYVWTCQDEAPDHLPCDVPQVSQSYWRSICGSPEACIATWRPVVATTRARRQDRRWSIVTLDPSGAKLFAADSQSGVRAWAYRGRPVFTFVKDQKPGDIYGHHIGSIGWGYNMLRADGVPRTP